MKLTETTKLCEAKKLYHTAFPKEERLPWWVLRLMTFQKSVELTAYYHGAEFWGFTHSTVTDQVLFVMFFAVSEELRGTGCGSAILSHLKEQHPEKAIILNIEHLDDHADNAEERVMRMRFYHKNGFFDTGYDIAEVGGVFRVLSTNPVLDVEAYLRVFKKLSCGFWKPKITRVK